MLSVVTELTEWQMHFFLCRRAKEVWPDLQGSDPQQVRWRCDLAFIWCKWLQRVCFNHPNFAPSILGAAQTLCAASSSFLPYWVILQWAYSVRKQHCSLVYMSNIAAYRSTNACPFATFTFNFCASSLVPGWPQEGDLSHRQPRAVLWAGWHPTRVSCFPIIDHNSHTSMCSVFILWPYWMYVVTGTSDCCSTSTSWSVPAPWCCWSSSVRPRRYELHSSLFMYTSPGIQNLIN